ncbi:hypothetical protein GCM10028791_18230 [Echinicola sediminis]
MRCFIQYLHRKRWPGTYTLDLCIGTEGSDQVDEQWIEPDFGSGAKVNVPVWLYDFFHVEVSF